MAESWKTITDELIRMFGNNMLWLLFVVSLVYLFFADRRWRKLVIFPSVVFCVLVIEPHLYQYVWSRFLGDTYWRALWIIPLMPVIACTIVDITGKIRGKTIRVLTLAGILFLIAGCGSYVYGNAMTTFDPAGNPHKLPQDAVEVCDFLLEIDDHPRIVTEWPLYNYVRQYSADIQMMYGRDAEGYIDYIDSARKRVADELGNENPDLGYVYEMMSVYNYTYLVKSGYDESWDETYAQAGFERIGLIEEYGVFQRF